MYKRMIAVVLVAAVVLGGCVSAGPHTLGSHPLPDGTSIEYHQIVSKGQGQEVLSVKGYRCEPAAKDADGKVTAWKNCVKETEDTAVGDSAVYGLGKAALTGAAAGAFIGTGIGVAGAAKVTQTGAATTGASKSSSGATSTGAVTGSGASVTTTVSSP